MGAVSEAAVRPHSVCWRYSSGRVLAAAWPDGGDEWHIVVRVVERRHLRHAAHDHSRQSAATASKVTDVCGWTALMGLHVDVVLPAPHPQKDAPHNRDVVKVMRVERDLGRRAGRDLVGGQIVNDIDYGHGATSRYTC